MNPIEAAVLPLKNDAINRADKEANEAVSRVENDLAANDWDANKVAPYPESHLDRVSYYVAKAKHYLYINVTEDDNKYSRSPKSPNFRKASPEKRKKFVEQSKVLAGDQYDAFVAKLVQKVGDVVSAELTGNHVWGYSILKVVKADGSVEKWKTQQIVNVSKLGALFNQWPTRKVK